MRHHDDTEQEPFCKLIESGRLYEAFAAAEAKDYTTLLRKPSLIDGVEVIGGTACPPGDSLKMDR